MKNHVKKIKLATKRSKLVSMAVFVMAFAGIGGLIVLVSRAAPGVCDPAGAIGSSTYTVAAPEAGQYRLWVRMQVPDTANASNTNGVRVELAGSSNQCFNVTTTSGTATSSWQWVNSDANSASTAHVTSQMAAGNYTAKIIGYKAGVKVDKVLLLKSDNNCTPDNVKSTGREPGDNCTTLPPTVDIQANPTSVTSGSTTSLSWTSTNATSCSGSGAWGNNTRSLNETAFTTAALTSTSTFTLTCTNAGGTGTDSVTVQVNAAPAPAINFSATQTTVVSGSASTLNWTTTNATSCSSTGGVNSWANANRGTSGTFNTGNLTANQTYNLSCTGPGGTTAATPVTITVTTTPPPNDTQNPTVNMGFTNVTFGTNETTKLVRNVKSVTWQPSATDNAGNPTLVLTVNGQPVSLTGGSYTFGNGNTNTTRNGDYVLRAVATDAAGNSTTQTLTVRLRHPDFDRSGVVDISDIGAMGRLWGQASTNYDVDLSGTIDISDIGFVGRQWGSTQ